MKKIYRAFIIICLGLATYAVSAQCVPDTEGCLDPEENGEICPDTLLPAALQQNYSEVVTILVPKFPSDTVQVPLHHLTLIDVQNLPPGITWESNEPNNEFLAEQYYCILIDGTPTDTGRYYLKIIVDVYIDLLGTPVLAGQQVDSTSVFMEVIDDTGLDDLAGDGFSIASCHPNPFRDNVTLEYTADGTAPVLFEVFDLTGQKIHSETVPSMRGGNTVRFDGSALPSGLYFFRLDDRAHLPVNVKVMKR